MQIIDKTSSVPYYEQLAELLRREIRERQRQDQAFQLPSENELAELHGLSRATVRHGMEVLEREGLIYREKGVGSFAAIRRVEHELSQLVSTTEAMRQRGWSLATRLVSLNRMTNAAAITHALELPEGAPLYELCRLRIVDGEPLSLETAYLPVQLCPNLEENDLTQSLYLLLESRYGLRLWTGREILRARGANPYEAHLLDIKEKTPLMSMERLTYAANGLPVEYLEAVWRGDRYDFIVTLTRPPSS